MQRYDTLQYVTGDDVIRNAMIQKSFKKVIVRYYPTGHSADLTQSHTEYIILLSTHTNNKTTLHASTYSHAASNLY
jgi:hypothetical protein